ncbi:MAG: NADH-quinone oxidoreductase subunit NuoK [FCB group bacterium]|nr:NADH-quinone oxidoreductase subunit NuoK [FCB group bacterium]
MDNLHSYLIISSILFSLGLFGVMTRRNGVAVLMGIELILNAANLNFVAFNRFGGMAELDGQVFGIFIIVLAAAEAAVALAIIINLFKNHETVNIDSADQMKG